MLYYFFGENKQKVSERASALISSLLKKRPEAERFDVDGDFFDTDNFKEIVFGQGLFGKSYIVVLNNIVDSERVEVFLEYLEDVKNSPNIFILKSGNADSKIRKQIESFSEKSVEVLGSGIQKAEKSNFNIFSISDKLGERDRRGLWLSFWRAVRGGHDSEEVFWKLVWQIKNMKIASEDNFTKDTDMKPFVFEKAKRYSENFSTEELQDMFNSLNKIFHDTRSGKVEFDIALERFVLGI